MQTVTTDFIELNQVKEFLKRHHSINVNDIKKENLGQSILNNKFFHDFDMDGQITFDDYNIAWNWLLQGKPTDIMEYAQNKSASPRGYKIPYQYIQDNEDNILLDNRVPSYDENTGTLGGEQTVSTYSTEKVSSFGIKKMEATEPSSDFNNDGEIDELDLQILEAYILMKPATVEEYNANRGDFPVAVTLPTLTTGKFACDETYVYGDIDTSGHGIINNDDINYYLDILNGSRTMPGENTIAYTLANTIANSEGTGRSDFTGPNFQHLLMACNLRDELVSTDLHSETIKNRIDYRDYLIMQEWLRLGNPDPKNLQTSESLLTWFNENKGDNIPTACALPIELYESIGASSFFFDMYSGEENL